MQAGLGADLETDLLLLSDRIRQNNQIAAAVSVAYAGFAHFC